MGSKCCGWWSRVPPGARSHSDPRGPQGDRLSARVSHGANHRSAPWDTSPMDIISNAGGAGSFLFDDSSSPVLPANARGRARSVDFGLPARASRLDSVPKSAGPARPTPREYSEQKSWCGLARSFHSSVRIAVCHISLDFSGVGEPRIVGYPVRERGVFLLRCAGPPPTADI